MINYFELLDEIMLKGIKISDEDLKVINKNGLESPVSKIIIIYYYLKSNISDEEKNKLEKEAWKISKEIRKISDEHIKNGEIKKAKEITNLKNRTLNCFLKIEGVLIEKEEKLEIGKEKKHLAKENIKNKKKKSNLKKVLVVTIIPLIILIIFNFFIISKKVEINEIKEERKIEIVEYDLSSLIESVKPKMAFKNDDVLYIIISKEDEEKKEDLKYEIENKLRGIAKNVIVQSENGEEIFSLFLH